jgi:hypothetical protein
MQKKIGIGSIRVRKDGMAEYAIIGVSQVKTFLELLYPFLVLKRNLVVLIFRIIERLDAVQTEADFIEVCYLVDKVAEHTYSKGRKNTASVVKDVLVLPVETEKL